MNGSLSFNSFKGRRVLVTGHTGFCGSWLSLWLNELGAVVAGLSKSPNTEPNMHHMLDIWASGTSLIGDISEPGVVTEAVSRVQPEIIFHLAAQPLVRQSYYDTLETYRSNVIGTAEVLESIRRHDCVRAAVIVTTDKVYLNQETNRAYQEDDRLGGKDPYSASKAACELVISSYLDTVLDQERVLCASARGGNIIGGGDWSADRLIPDIVRALNGNAPLIIRNPEATRPWQHVLALCHAYLQLAEGLFKGDKDKVGSWNFGPLDEGAMTTMQIVEAFGALWRTPAIEVQRSPLHEAQLLALNSNKARSRLGWRPSWSTQEGIERTVDWYHAHSKGADMQAFSLAQIGAYADRP